MIILLILNLDGSLSDLMLCHKNEANKIFKSFVNVTKVSDYSRCSFLALLYGEYTGHEQLCSLLLNIGEE